MNTKASKTKTSRPETYEVEAAGRKVRVTVPENDESDLFAAIREQISPEAVAAIASCLQASRTNNPDVDRQAGEVISEFEATVRCVGPEK